MVFSRSHTSVIEFFARKNDSSILQRTEDGGRRTEDGGRGVLYHTSKMMCKPNGDSPTERYGESVPPGGGEDDTSILTQDFRIVLSPPSSLPASSFR